ncbi:MAG: hypothetical protein JSS28_02180 [Proteobacteria bacterium]|nr:hypothetical protein [Pseudomonadota bacterium]
MSFIAFLDHGRAWKTVPVVKYSLTAKPAQSLVGPVVDGGRCKGLRYGAFAGFDLVPQTNRVAHFIRLTAHRAARGRHLPRRHFHFYKSHVLHSWLRKATAAPLGWRHRHWLLAGILFVF